MTIVYTSPLFQEHKTGAHPETARRLSAIDAYLAKTNALAPFELGNLATASENLVRGVHAESVLRASAALAGSGGGYLDPDTVLSAKSYDVALLAAGTAAAAVDAVLSGAHQRALCLVRPPGHHATRDQSMGFCLFNNVAIAAQHALGAHLAQRILIVDWDVHHGNGTQDIFYDRGDVVFYSIHRHPFYPGSGTEDESGTGKGRGATFNVPVAFGTPRAQYMELFRAGLERAARRAKPELILLSAGFDAHSADPVGNLGLEAEDFEVMTKLVRDVADVYCQGRIVSCLEGGYNLEALAASVGYHLKALQ